MKKNLVVFCASIIVLSASAEVFAQTRGPRYNPGGGSSSSSSPSQSRPSSTPAPSSSSSSSSSTQRGPRYNPNPGSSSSSTPSTQAPSRTSSVPSSSSSSRPTQTGPRYNPTPAPSYPSQPTTTYRPAPSYPSTTYPSSSGPVVRGPRYNPPVTSNYYQVPSHQQGHVVINRTVVHSPYPVTYNTVRYYSYNDYYSSVNHRYIYRSWLQEPVVFSYSNGYWMIDNYPYYVYRGFRYRYHPVELCNYQLVDSSGYSVSRSYGYTACSVSYDRCASERDMMNRNLYSDRYFCAENVGYQYANNNDSDYYGYARDIDYAEQAQIDDFLAYRSYLDLFYAGQNYQAGNCSIQNQGYSYVVRVNGYTYPEAGIDSSSYSASQMGCNVGSEAENAGCILKAAAQEGYCF